MSILRADIIEEMHKHGDAWGNIVSHTPFDDYLDREVFGLHFTLWTEKRVYFPGVYDNFEFVASVPRNPCDEETEPVGGC